MKVGLVRWPCKARNGCFHDVVTGWLPVARYPSGPVAVFASDSDLRAFAREDRHAMECLLRTAKSPCTPLRAFRSRDGRCNF